MNKIKIVVSTKPKERKRQKPRMANEKNVKWQSQLLAERLIVLGYIRRYIVPRICVSRKAAKNAPVITIVMLCERLFETFPKISFVIVVAVVSL